MSVESFIREEVTRQGFNPGTISFNRRVDWMRQAWQYARRNQPRRPEPSLGDIVRIGKLIEPMANHRGLRLTPVQIEGRTLMAAELVPRALQNLVTALGTMQARDAYTELMRIHPFRDGNGRAGKIVYNWLLSHLADPLLPPDPFVEAT